MQNKTEILTATAAAVGASAAAGSVATKTDSLWYITRRKPAFQPPAWLFPVAWTALYVDIAAVTGTTLVELKEQGKEEEFKRLAGALGLNLALNTGWCSLFFRGKKPALATAEAAALAASSADLVRRCVEVKPKRGWWLAPYAAWTGFATVLTGAIWLKNRKK